MSRRPPATLAPGRDHGSGETVRYIRPAALPGVEVLHATFVAHRYAPHLHEAWTVAAVDGGAASFDLEGDRHTAPAGTVFVIPPRAVHTGEPATTEGYRYKVLYLETQRPSSALPEGLLSRPRHALPVVLRHRELASTLFRLHGSLDVGGQALEQSELLASVTAELTALVCADPGPALSEPPGSVARARSFIEAHWRDDFTVAELAEAAEASPSHLIRLFHRQLGVPPSAYRRALRVRAAQRLLRDGWPPAAAAAECGFCDQSHLNRVFKSATGVTPGQYALAGLPTWPAQGGQS